MKVKIAKSGKSKVKLSLPSQSGDEVSIELTQAELDVLYSFCRTAIRSTEFSVEIDARVTNA